MASIRQIDAGCVHRICSGQVVTDLTTAVKELVENSLDAGATLVEVNLKDYGTTSIEVSDNGSGVHADYFQALTRKHWTSKLSSFEDLEQVDTLGFRGEALSSLCALGNLRIITCTEDSAVGTLLEYNHDGELTRSVPQARTRGTTVTVENLFCTLPVRQKAFARAAKNEYARLLPLLQSYALAHPLVKLRVTHHGKSGRDTVFSTPGSVPSHTSALPPASPSTTANPHAQAQTHASAGLSARALEWPLRALFGAKELSKLEFVSFRCEGVAVEGFLSRLEGKCGRSSADRQFVWLNRRPVELPSLTRAVSEVYQQYAVGGGVYHSTGAQPLLFLHVSAPPGAFDVNVTPNKRTVFLHGEARLVAELRAWLAARYEHGESHFAVRTLEHLLTRNSSGLSQAPTAASSEGGSGGGGGADDMVDADGVGVGVGGVELATPLTPAIPVPSSVPAPTFVPIPAEATALRGADAPLSLPRPASPLPAPVSVPAREAVACLPSPPRLGACGAAMATPPHSPHSPRSPRTGTRSRPRTLSRTPSPAASPVSHAHAPRAAPPSPLSPLLATLLSPPNSPPPAARATPARPAVDLLARFARGPRAPTPAALPLAGSEATVEAAPSHAPTAPPASRNSPLALASSSPLPLRSASPSSPPPSPLRVRRLDSAFARADTPDAAEDGQLGRWAMSGATAAGNTSSTAAAEAVDTLVNTLGDADSDATEDEADSLPGRARVAAPNAAATPLLGAGSAQGREVGEVVAVATSPVPVPPQALPQPCLPSSVPPHPPSPSPPTPRMQTPQPPRGGASGDAGGDAERTPCAYKSTGITAAPTAAAPLAKPSPMALLASFRRTPARPTTSISVTASASTSPATPAFARPAQSPSASSAPAATPAAPLPAAGLRVKEEGAGGALVDNYASPRDAAGALGSPHGGARVKRERDTPPSSLSARKRYRCVYLSDSDDDGDIRDAQAKQEGELPGAAVEATPNNAVDAPAATKSERVVPAESVDDDAPLPVPTLLVPTGCYVPPAGPSTDGLEHQSARENVASCPVTAIADVPPANALQRPADMSVVSVTDAPLLMSDGLADVHGLPEDSCGCACAHTHAAAEAEVGCISGDAADRAPAEVDGAYAGAEEDGIDVEAAAVKAELLARAVCSTHALRVDTSAILAAFAQTRPATHARAVARDVARPPAGSAATAEEVVCRFDPGEAAQGAEATLSRKVSKQDFANMRVLGQFNKGFILAQLRGDVFIVDQHASDEKHTYETIKAQCKLHQQPLIAPQPLPLSRAHEEVVLAHMDQFRALGFHITRNPAFERVEARLRAREEQASLGGGVDEEDEDEHAVSAMPRLVLRALPSFRQLALSHIDIADLCEQLTDNPYVPPVIRRLDAAHASRACRTSVMIGTVLARSHMERIVASMQGLEQPWACPHGRPTMRHLADLRAVGPEVARNIAMHDANMLVFR